MLRSRRRIFLIAVIAVCWGTLWVLWISRRPQSLGSVARDVLKSLRQGDGTEIYPYLTEEEKKTNSITPESIRAVHQLVIAPKLNKLGRPQLEYTTDYGHEGLSQIDFGRPNGDFTQFGPAVFRRDGRPITSLSSLVYGLWISEALVRTKEPWSERVRARAIADGIERDGATLERLGWKEIFALGPRGVERLPLKGAAGEFRAFEKGKP